MRHKVFLSYCHQDEEDVAAIARFLVLIGVDVWFDQRQGPFQGELPPALCTAIDESEYFAFVESTHTNSPTAYLQLEARHFRDSRGSEDPLPFILIRLSRGTLPPAIAEFAPPIGDVFDLSDSFLDGLSKLACFFCRTESGILKYYSMDKLVPPYFLDMLIERARRTIRIMGHSMAALFGDRRDVSLVGPAVDGGAAELRILLLTPNLPKLQQLREAQLGMRPGTALRQKILDTLLSIRSLKADREDVGHSARIQVRVTDRIMYSKLYFADSLGVVTNYSSVSESGDNSPAYVVHSTGEPRDLHSLCESEFERCWQSARHPEEAKRHLESNDASRILAYREHASRINAWLDGKKERLPLPAMLILYPTYECSVVDSEGNPHAVCPNCIYKEKRGPRHMPFEVLTNALLEAAKAGIKRIEFSGGGEPLQYCDLPRLLESVQQLGRDRDGMIFGLLTNGLHLREASIDNLAPAFSYIRISYPDGLLADADLTRDFLSGFTSFLKSVRDSETPRIGVKFLVSHDNAASLVGKMLELREAVGEYLFRRIEHMRVKAMRSSRRVIEPNPEDLAIFKDSFFDHLYTYPRNWPDDVQVDLDLDDVPGDFHCRLSPLAAVVDPDGVVWPCCNYLNMRTHQQIGDLRNQNFGQFWGNERHREIVLGIDPRHVCNARNGASCRFAKYQMLLANSVAEDKPSITWTSVNFL